MKFSPPPQPLSPDDAWDAFNSFIDIANGDDSESLHRIIHSLINRIAILNDDITFFGHSVNTNSQTVST